MQRFFGIVVAIAALSVSGCASTVFSMPPYQPVTTAEIEAGIEVKEFKYFPKKGVGPNVIHNTAAGELKLTEPVGDYIAGAVKREFRQAGITLKPESHCHLDGEVNDLTIDDLGFSADYVSDFRYVLSADDGKALLDNSYQVKFNTTKFVVAEIIFSNLQKVISANIAKLMEDPDFIRITQTDCRKA